MHSKGHFVVFEGLDGAGKTTQVEKLLTWIAADLKQPCVTMRFPDRTTPVGQLIDSYLQNHAKGQDDMSPEAMHLLFSANRWELKGRIEKLMREGTTIVCDRYCHSGSAYSVAAHGFCREWAEAPDQGLPQPDLVVYLRMSSPKISIERRQNEHTEAAERYEKLHIQTKVAEEFDRYADADSNRWMIIDADKPAEIVHTTIIAGLMKRGFFRK